MISVDYRGYRTRVVDRGRGKPIVFVHNAGVSHRLWDHQLARFERSHRVVAPDLLGLGDSDRPEIVYTADLYVGQVEHLVDHLDLEGFHLVGCCLGGGIALEYARRHPGRVQTLSVITAATPGTIASGIFGPAEAVSKPGSRRRDLIWRLCDTAPGRWAMTRAFYRAQCGPKVLADAAFKDYVRRLYRSEGQWRVFCNTSLAGFGHLDAFVKPPGFPPTLVMWGERNPILRADAGRRLTAAIRPERSEFWEDAGYMLMREHPQRTNQVLADFFETPHRESRARARGASAHGASGLNAPDARGVLRA